MKVAFVTPDTLDSNENYQWSAYANRAMIKAMPCHVVICHSLDEVKQIVSTVDVVLLDIDLPFREQLTFLNDLQVVVGGFHLDSWKAPFWHEETVDVDLNIFVYKAITAKGHPEVVSSDTFLWLPPRTDIIDYGIEKDLDIVTWGCQGREYIFRNFTFWHLTCLNSGGPRRRPSGTIKVDAHLTIWPITLNGIQYQWGDLRAKRWESSYHGPELFRFLQRSRLCATGPPVQFDIDIPVARYIENAANGIVSLTCDISDKEELGFEHAKNIWITDGEHFGRDLAYLFEHPDLVEDMSRNAIALVRERHSIEIRAKQLYSALVEKVKSRRLRFAKEEITNLQMKKISPEARLSQSPNTIYIKRGVETVSHDLVTGLNPLILRIDGHMQEDELCWILAKALDIPNGGKVAEIGSFRGRSSAAWSQGLGTRATLYCIDLWAAKFLESDSIDLEIFKTNMKLLGFSPEVMQMPSVAASKLFDDRSLDVVFIDRSNDEIILDLNLWINKVKDGGFLCGYGWGSDSLGEQKALEKYPGAQNVIGSLWVVTPQ